MKYGMILAFVLSVLITTGVYAAIEDQYNYYTTIKIENNNSTAITEPFLFTINAQGLSDGYFVNSNFEDIMVSTYSGTEHFTVMDITNGTATWRLNHTTIDANNSTIKTLHIGSPTATRGSTHSSTSHGMSGNKSVDDDPAQRGEV